MNRLRLIIEPPQPDESLSSVLDRASALYGMETTELLASIYGKEIDRKRVGDLDRLPDSLIDPLAHSIGISPDQLAECRINDSAHLLSFGFRTAFCPICLSEDLDVTGIPYFRKEWASFFSIVCRKHETVLVEWAPATGKQTRALPRRSLPDGTRWRFGDAVFGCATVLARVLAEPNFELVQLIIALADFSSAFERELSRLDCTNMAQQLTAREMVGFLLFLLTNQSSFPAALPLAGLAPCCVVPGIFRSPKHTEPPLRGNNPWDYLARIADPAVRRSAMFVSAIDLHKSTLKSIYYCDNAIAKAMADYKLLAQ